MNYQCYNLDDRTVHKQCCENLKSYTQKKEDQNGTKGKEKCPQMKKIYGKKRSQDTEKWTGLV
jgi:hypothetical protein